ncbi:hypothetical protein DA803_01595 [[Mycoplasma] phocae]|uniref:BspA family leucine-rich repeat surface protein n=1 Tax=[Mycoplasma] phocae TaxID=142651 RepID=A0A2Z5IPW5_9BACT|nr:BspA family leucine-rich repeat surface protein [[Mycoplasma] phocae]AXE60779.1 hypothetical protein DA803_01595 [[Mycoplasma] phocae]
MKNKLKLLSIISALSSVSLPFSIISTKTNQNTPEDNLEDNSITAETQVQSVYNGTECIKIGYFKNFKGEYQIEQFHKDVTAVPKDLPKEITLLKNAFKDCINFNQDLSSWDISNVKDMSSMFEGALAFNNGEKTLTWKGNAKNNTATTFMFKNAKKFNQDISSWDVSNVKSMWSMFEGAESFNNGNKPLIWKNGWTNKRTTMLSMFKNAKSFNQDISSWDVSNVWNMESMFEGTKLFNQDLSNWKVSNVWNTGSMFEGTEAYNNAGKPLSWGDSAKSITSTVSMFKNAKKFNQDISGWNLSKIVNMVSMFEGAENFNNGGNVLNWENLKVKYVSKLFKNAKSFNQDLSNWDISNLSEMSSMFEGADAFNNGGQPLTWINLSKAKKFDNMFKNAKIFNQNIAGWDVSSAEDMSSMFEGADAFNNGGQPLTWTNLSKVKKFNNMFKNAKIFNQNISTWDVSNAEDMSSMFCGAQTFNQSIADWNVSNVKEMALMFQDAKFFNQNLSKWNVSNVWNMLSMFEGAEAYNNAGESLNWGDSTKNLVSTASMFKNAKSFNQDISSWDVSNVWKMNAMFENAVLFNNGGKPLNWKNAIKGNISTAFMFKNAKSFNQDISSWDVSKVESMESMFEGASSFNNGGQPFNWNSSSNIVTNVSKMFKDATSFNQNVTNFDVRNVNDMSSMFEGASSFNNGDQELRWFSWTSNVKDMSSMFKNATNFNQDLSNFWAYNVKTMESMFEGASSFNNGGKSFKWNSLTIIVTNVSKMFKNATSFNQNVTNFDVRNVNDMSSMFEGASSFNNGDAMELNWNTWTENVKNMSKMFKDATSFNKKIIMKTKNVENMTSMFENTKAFNQNISNWNVDKVVNYDNFYNKSKLISNPKNIPQKLLKELKYLITVQNFTDRIEKIDLKKNKNIIIDLIKARNNNPEIFWDVLSFDLISSNDDYLEILISDKSKKRYLDKLKLKFPYKKDIKKEIKVDNLAKVEDFTEEEIKRVINAANGSGTIDWSQLKITINQDKIIITVSDNSADYLKGGTISFTVVKKLDIATVISETKKLAKVEDFTEEEIKRVINAANGSGTIDWSQLKITINQEKIMISVADNSADYLKGGTISFTVVKKLDIATVISETKKLAKVEDFTEEEIKRVINAANGSGTIDWSQLKITINQEKIMISVADNSADYLKGGTISFTVTKKIAISTIISKTTNLAKVEDFTEEEIKRVINAANGSGTIDWSQLKITINQDKIIITVSDNSADYLKGGTISFTVVKKLDIATVISETKKLAKVEDFTEEEIKRVINAANSNVSIDWSQLKITINQEKIMISVADNSADYLKGGTISFTVTKKIAISTIISKTTNLAKVEDFTEEEIKRVINAANGSGTIDWSQLKITINQEKIMISVADNSADYLKGGTISFTVVKKLDIATVISETKKLAKVEDFTEEEIKRVINAANSNVSIDWSQLKITINQEKIMISVADNSADYLKGGTISFTVVKKLDIATVISETKKLAKVEDFTEEEIKRVINAANGSGTIDWSQLKITINQEKIMISVADNSADYLKGGTISFTVTKKIAISTIISKTTNLAKVEDFTEEEIKRVINAANGSGTIDWSQLKITINQEKIMISVADNSADYLKGGTISFTVTKKIAISTIISKTTNLAKVEDFTEEEIKRVINAANGSGTIDWSQLKITINQEKIMISVADNSADYLKGGTISFTVTKKIAISTIISKTTNLAKVEDFTEEEIKRVINAANSNVSIDWSQLKITINQEKIMISVADNSADYLKGGTISFTVTKKIAISTIISKTTNLAKVEDFTEEEIKRVINAANGSGTIDWSQLKITINQEKIMISVADNSADYLKGGTISFTVTKKIAISTIISKTTNLAKVEDFTEEEIKRVINAANGSGTIDWSQLKITINQEKIMISVADNSADYLKGGTISFTVTKKIAISTIISKTTNLAKVEDFTEEEIKRVINAANGSGTIDWSQLKITINQEKIMISVADNSADYLKGGTISFTVTKKIAISTIISKTTNLAKVEDFTEEEIKRVINAANSNVSIDWSQLKITINQEKIMISVADNSADYLKGGTISFTVVKKLDIATVISETKKLAKVEDFTEEEIKRVINAANGSGTIDWSQLKITINQEKIMISVADNSADYLKGGTISFTVTKKIAISTIISKTTNLAKVEDFTEEEIKRVINAANGSGTIDWSQLKITINQEKIMISVADNSADYLKGETISFTVTKKSAIATVISKTSGLAKVENFTKDEIKRVINEANKGKDIQWEQLEITITGANVIIKVLANSADYQKGGTISFTVVKKLDIAKLIGKMVWNAQSTITIEELAKFIKKQYPEIDFSQIDLIIANDKSHAIIRSKVNSKDYFGEASLPIKKNINEAIKDKEINFELGKVDKKDINKKNFKSMISRILREVDLINLDFDVTIDKKNNKVNADFSHDAKFYGELNFNYEAKSQNNKLPIILAITSLLGIIGIIIVITLLVLKKKGKIFNKNKK